MAFPQHFPPPSPVTSIFPTKSLSFSYLLSTLLSISSWAYLSFHYHLPAVSQFSLSNTTHLSSQHGQTTSTCFNCMTSATSSIASMFLTYSLLLLSLKLTPVIHLNILILLLCIFLQKYSLYLCWPCLTAIQHCRSYACCIDSLPFDLRLISFPISRPESSLNFNQSVCILFSIACSQPPWLSMSPK